MTTKSDTREGVVESLKLAWASLLAGLSDRAELLSIELEQEKLRLFGDLLAVLAFSFCLFMTFISLNVALFVLLWDERMVLSIILCAGYGLASGILAWVVRRRRRNAPRPLEATLNELRRDRSMMGKP